MDADTVPIKVLCRIRPLSNNEVLDRCQFLPVLYDDKTSLSLSVSNHQPTTVFSAPRRALTYTYSKLTHTHLTRGQLGIGKACNFIDIG